ncbi:sec-independent protein translocase protein TatA [Scopulibacillus darangshiensis]|uniref:Sec-independent protein translocase protein TatA n=1 Tax=Scopulibacillus darangshiensis TaxID=442528 RepID=A0A4R2P3X1_9BACL|nr:twin-arginine translocase TatA/TatE family subunit [Scopulibacillus darangshiensis]TCP29412.1 sec-independent protein translocase protein TatA [Scopulibacillus darangshiensis]
MPFNIGIGGFMLIFTAAILLFGPKKLPELGRAVGQTLKEFKRSVNDITDSQDSDVNRDQNKEN